MSGVDLDLWVCGKVCGLVWVGGWGWWWTSFAVVCELSVNCLWSQCCVCRRVLKFEVIIVGSLHGELG